MILFARKSELRDPMDALPILVARYGMGIGFALWWGSVFGYILQRWYSLHYADEVDGGRASSLVCYYKCPFWPNLVKEFQKVSIYAVF